MAERAGRKGEIGRWRKGKREGSKRKREETGRKGENKGWKEERREGEERGREGWREGEKEGEERGSEINRSSFLGEEVEITAPSC